MQKTDTDFEALYKSFYPLLCRTVFNMVRDKEITHDLVQEVFVKLWDNNQKLSHILNIKAYLYRAVINAAINHLDHQKKQRPITEFDALTNPNKISEYDLKELELKIESALNKLPAQCKAIFVLNRFENMKNKEIASMLNLSLKTVENQMGIALKKMHLELDLYIKSNHSNILSLYPILLLLAYT